LCFCAFSNLAEINGDSRGCGTERARKAAANGQLVCLAISSYFSPYPLLPANVLAGPNTISLSAAKHLLSSLPSALMLKSFGAASSQKSHHFTLKY